MSDTMSRDNYGLVSFGEELSSGRPAEHLADLDAESLATPERLEAVAMFWPRSSLADYDVLSRKLLRRRADDKEFRVVEHDPLMAADPWKDEIEAYLVHAGHVVYLAPRVVTSARGLDSATVAGVIEDDGHVLRDTETGVRRLWNKRKGRFV